GLRGATHGPDGVRQRGGSAPHRGPDRVGHSRAPGVARRSDGYAAHGVGPTFCHTNLSKTPVDWGAPARHRCARYDMTIVDALSRDVRHGFRSLRRDLGAALLVVAIAGLGIGASTTVFSICRALLLRPLPFREPDRLVWIANGTSENLSAQTVQVNNLIDLRTSSRSFVDIAGFYAFYAPGDIRLTGAGEAERITGVPVTQSFFPLLGVEPLVGRFFDS